MRPGCSTCSHYFRENSLKFSLCGLILVYLERLVWFSVLWRLHWCNVSLQCSSVELHYWETRLNETRIIDLLIDYHHWLSDTQTLEGFHHCFIGTERATERPQTKEQIVSVSKFKDWLMYWLIMFKVNLHHLLRSTHSLKHKTVLTIDWIA